MAHKLIKRAFLNDDGRVSLAHGAKDIRAEFFGDWCFSEAFVKESEVPLKDWEAAVKEKVGK